MSRRFYLFGLLPCLFLSGCLGTAFLFESDDGCTDSFPSLHDVPDKPKSPDVKKQKETEEALSRSQEQVLMQNQKLREQFNLETSRTGKQSEENNQN